MKAKKLWTTLLCAALLSTSLAACGGNTSNSSTDTGNNSTSGTDTTQSAEQSSAESYDHADITMLIISPMPNEDAYNRIAEEMSKITEEKFNATMHLMGVSISDYANKMNLALASGDPLDIFQGFTMYNQFISMGYMLNLDPYTDMLQDAFNTVGDTVRQGYYHGSLYSLPIINLGATGGDGIAFRKDIIDELGIDLSQYPLFPDLEDALVKIKEAHPDMTPMMSGGTNNPTIAVSTASFDGKYVDGLSNAFCFIDPSDPNAKVQVNVMTDTFRQMCDVAWDWAQKGLLGYDEISIDYDNVKAGRAAAINQAMGPAATMEAESVTGYEMVMWNPQTEGKPYITTNNAWSWSITEYTEHPEQAVAILNELYTNADLSNLLVWGVEGEHYQIVDKEKGLVDFLPGENPGNAKYYNLIKDNVPNLYICYEGVYDVPNKYEAYQEYKANNMQVSPYLGFLPNEDAYANEATACNNVLSQYRVGLLSGQLDPATAYDEMISQLEAAGIETIREEIQTQLDAWIEENAQ